MTLLLRPQGVAHAGVEVVVETNARCWTSRSGALRDLITS